MPWLRTCVVKSLIVESKISSDGMQDREEMCRLMSNVGRSPEPSHRNVSTSGLVLLFVFDLLIPWIQRSMANGRVICA